MTNKIHKLWYVGLESYQSRYSFQLTGWNTSVFKEMGIDYEVVHPVVNTVDQGLNDGTISIGQVLDAAGRPYYALGQIQKLLVDLKQGRVTDKDVIFFEDMFHPGIESLAYLLDQMTTRPRIYVRCLAQTIDPDDFVNDLGMGRWMRPFEQMVLRMVDGVFAASHEMVSHMVSAGWDTKVAVTGLPFGRREVVSRCAAATEVQNTLPVNEQAHPLPAWESRPKRVVFAARFDSEKQPDLFLKLAHAVKTVDPTIEFMMLSGKDLVSNSRRLVDEIDYAAKSGLITLQTNLSKDEYYTLLANSRVLVNTALQDWVSNTVSEADALGCNTLYPAYRSFIEVFKSDHNRLYVPWSLPDMQDKLFRLLETPHPRLGEISQHQDGTIRRTVDLMQSDDPADFINPSAKGFSTIRTEFNRNDWRLK